MTGENTGIEALYSQVPFFFQYVFFLIIPGLSIGNQCGTASSPDILWTALLGLFEYKMFESTFQNLGCS